MNLFFLIIILLVQVAIIYLVITKNNNKVDVISIQKTLDKIEVSIYNFEKNLKDEFQRNRSENNDLSFKNRNELRITLDNFAQNLNNSTKDIKSDINKQLDFIRKDNSEKLNEMRHTVDEKLSETLEKRLGESFKLVSERLEQVHKGLGEMQSIASGVGDLKRVLSNVKTRGVLGEYQLENILEQILTSEQYAKNVATKKGSQANVEFAIKLPGKNSDETVWMPVDSKFPIENYEALLNASEEGNIEVMDIARKSLYRSIELFAKDIHTKYIDPPFTTDFAIMFLPTEGLYAEILRQPGLFETLQTKYKITITGPTTLAALLNSLNMGFRTLAVQKRSSEVWNILSAVKTEFNNFSKQLDEVDKSLNTASTKLSKLKNTRTNVMNRKLKEVGTLDNNMAKNLLEINE